MFKMTVMRLSGCCLVAAVACSGAFAAASAEVNVGLGEGQLASAVCTARTVVLSPDGRQFLVGDSQVQPTTTPELFGRTSLTVMTFTSDTSSTVEATASRALSRGVFFHPSGGLVEDYGDLIAFTPPVGQRVTRLTWVPGTRVAGGPVERQGSRARLSVTGWPHAVPGSAPIAMPLQGEGTLFSTSPLHEGLVSVSMTALGWFQFGSLADGALWLKAPDGTIEQLPGAPSRHAFHNPIVYQTGGGGYGVFARGLAMVRNPSGWREVPDAPLYSQPLVDAGTGTVVALYGPDRIVALSSDGLHPASARLAAEAKLWTDRGWSISSASVHQESGTSVLIVRAPSTTRGEWDGDQAALIALNGTAETHRLQCRTRDQWIDVPIVDSIVHTAQPDLDQMDDAPTVRNNFPVPVEPALVHSISPPPVVRTFRVIGPETHPVGWWEAGPVGAEARGTVVIYRGGPTSNLLDFNLTEDELHLIRLGFRLVWIEYSGATEASPALFARLAAGRDEALRTDANVVARELAARSFPGPILVKGSSFGAVPASYLVEAIPDRIAGAILVVPFGQWRDRASSSQNETVILRQRQFDLATYGAPVDRHGVPVNTWLAQRQAIICRLTEVSLFFGVGDDLVKPEDWTEHCPNPKSVAVLHGGHALGTNPELAVRIAGIAASLTTQPPAETVP